ncbi:hypothetical protein H4R33_006487 [Dimargaris cristalligena]|nr:hypothetical protein H4R33_006487 [Dimargaris cristalligena]
MVKRSNKRKRDGESAEAKRLYVGGLAEAISDGDLGNKFKTYGEVTGVEIKRDNLTGVRTLHNARWLKKDLIVQVSKQSVLSKVTLERDASTLPEKPVKRNKAKLTNPSQPVIEEAADMSLVTDDNAQDRKGWEQSRYGRAVARMRMEKPDGTYITYDPTKYKSNLVKLSGRDVDSALPIGSLPWSIDDQLETPAHQASSELTATKNPDVPSAVPSMSLTESQAHPRTDSKKLTQEERIKAAELKRVESLARRSESKFSQRQVIQQALRTADGGLQSGPSKNKVVFEKDSSDDDDSDVVTEAGHAKVPTRVDTEDDYDSSDDDSPRPDQPGFDAAAAAKDPRFQLDQPLFGGKRKASPESQEESKRRAGDVSDANSDTEGNFNLAADRAQAQDVLRAMFSESKDGKESSRASWGVGDDPATMAAEADGPTQEAVESHYLYWKPMVRFDPDAPDCTDLLLPGAMEEEEEEKEEAELMAKSSAANAVDPSLPPPKFENKPLPAVDTARKFAIQSDLRSLFGRSETRGDEGESEDAGGLGFSLLAGVDDDDFTDLPVEVVEKTETQEPGWQGTKGRTDKTAANDIETQRILPNFMFFFHHNNTNLADRSYYQENETKSIFPVPEDMFSLKQALNRQNKTAVRRTFMRKLRLAANSRRKNLASIKA